MEFYAHIDKSENRIRCQTVVEHCRNTAKYTVSLYQGKIKKIGRKGLYTRHGIMGLTDGFYDEMIGVTLEGENMPLLEVQQ